jgi:hypothetical protein
MIWPSFISSVDPILVQRETTRTWLAYGVSVAVGVVALMLIIWAFVHNTALQPLLTGIFTPLIGIAGTVLGFYFAGEKAK